MNQAHSSKKFSFRKEEKLCSEKIIAGLFQPGFFISQAPFRVNVLITPLPTNRFPAQVMFIVGKKKFRKAIDRNRIKRILRELYRLQKHEIYHTLEKSGKQAALALFYTGTGLPEYKSMKTPFNQLIQKLNHALAAK